MGKVSKITDGLSSVYRRIRGEKSFAQHFSVALTAAQIEAEYLGSGMMRKVVNIPAEDSVRDWREWQASGDELAKIHAEEKRLNLQNVIMRMEVLRGLGGGAVIMGLPGLPSEPAPARITPGNLAFLNVVSRYKITLGDIIDDPTNPGYGGPSSFKIQTTTGEMKIHPSRVVAFKGSPIPDLQSSLSYDDRFWGESVVAAYRKDVNNYETAKASLLRMVTKAAYMRIGIPGLAERLMMEGGEANVAARAQLIADVTTIDAVVYDAGNGQEGSGERIEDATIQLTGIVETINGFGAQIAAVTDIPITRLMGKSASGMNSSGDSEQKDWNKAVAARQTLKIDPCLAQIDRYMIQSAGASDVSYIWPDLSQPTQKESSDRFLVTMNAVEKLIQTASVPDEAMAKGIQSLMIEEAWLPGLESALLELPDDVRYGLGQEDDDGTDPSALTQSDRFKKA